jgi:hypothetical protein
MTGFVFTSGPRCIFDIKQARLTVRQEENKARQITYFDNIVSVENRLMITV